jgi:hypothetical protein
MTMATVKINAYVHQQTSRYGEEEHVHYVVFHSEDMTSCGYVLIGPVEIDYTLPEDFNPVAAEVAAINKQIGKLKDECRTNVRRLNDRIQQLLCIENKPTAAAGA